jgi:hypothetical protein
MRRFPPPWAVERTAGGWSIRDANGIAVAFVYCVDGFQLENVGTYQPLTLDEGRRIARGIARLPDLLRSGRTQKSGPS